MHIFTFLMKKCLKVTVLLYGPLNLKDSIPARSINLRHIINILLTSFSRSLLSVTGPASFFPVDLWCPRFALGPQFVTYSTDLELG